MFFKLILKNYRNFANTNIIKKPFSNFTFVGGGKMAEGIINGLYSKKGEELNINVIENNEKRINYLKNKYTINDSLKIENSDFIFLCVKPQNIDTIKDYFNYNISDNQILISIIAGKSIDQLKYYLPQFKNIIRVMPNIAVNINKGTSIWYPSNNITNNQKNITKNILQILGDEIEVSDEDYIDMGTAISGTGPAYIFLLTESLIDSAVHLGFSRSVAEKIVLSTINGSSSLANEKIKINNDNISNIRYDVTSPGGTTASAVYELEKGSFRTIINNSVWAAYRKTMELGGKDSRVGPGRYKC